ncbi:MAG: hypothetical protein GEU99_16065 [Luteitalea sp.]|nr:hypothetical protein [Luteitalea sp.]
MSLFMRPKNVLCLLVGLFVGMPGIATAQWGASGLHPVTVNLPSPCRVVDTRGTGGRTGLLEPGAPRVFSLWDVVSAIAEQGGDACGIESEEDAVTFSDNPGVVWGINITVTGFSANGGLKAWKNGEQEPNSSVINYSSGHEPSVANFVMLKGSECVGCGDDIVVEAFGSPTHLIIDVFVASLPANELAPNPTAASH